MLMRAATVRRRQLQSIAVAAQDSAAEHCDGSRLRGDAGQLTRSPVVARRPCRTS